MLQSLFKKSPRQVFSCGICEIFKNTFFHRTLQWLLLCLTCFHVKVESVFNLVFNVFQPFNTGLKHDLDVSVYVVCWGVVL